MTRSKIPSKLPDPSVGTSSSKSLRGAEFGRLLKGWKFWVPTGVVGLGLFLYGLTQGPAIAVILPLIEIGIALWVTWRLAKERATNSFLEVYARHRGLRVEYASIPAKATPLLREGVEAGTKWTLTGEVAPGIDGVLAIYHYKKLQVGVDSTPGTEEIYFTIGVVELPECAALVPALYCRPKSGLRSLEGLEDAFRRGKKRVTLESEALAERYEIFVEEGQDEVWLRRLFSPTFVVWLAESSPDEFSFEVVDGTLVAGVPGEREDVVNLDALLAATGVFATRLREEASQSGIPAAPARAMPSKA